MRSIIAASIAALSFATPAPCDDVAEPSTGVTFASKVDGYTLLGVGLRVKKIIFIRAKVYAVGLYVSDAALGGPLAAYKGKLDSPEFFRDLQWGDFGKHLLLKFVRSVGQGQVQDAMREALAGRTDPGLLDRFVGYFPAIREGQECVLAWGPGGALEVSMVGQAKPPIASKEFAAAVFGLYVGETPLQPEIKKGLVSRAAEVLR